MAWKIRKKKYFLNFYITHWSTTWITRVDNSCPISKGAPFDMGQLYVAFSRSPSLARIDLSSNVTLDGLTDLQLTVARSPNSLQLLRTQHPTPTTHEPVHGGSGYVVTYIDGPGGCLRQT